MELFHPGNRPKAGVALTLRVLSRRGVVDQGTSRGRGGTDSRAVAKSAACSDEETTTRARHRCDEAPALLDRMPTPNSIVRAVSAWLLPGDRYRRR